MKAYLVRRLLLTLVALWGALSLVFVLMRLSGDPATLFAGQDAGPEELRRIRVALGLDDPPPVQYGRFLLDGLRGDFGTSIRVGRPALQLVAERLPATLELTGAALLLTTLVGVTAGTVAALRPGSLLDNAVTLASSLGQCMPAFWLGILLILLFAVELRVLPASGRGSAGHLVLPAVTLAAYTTARLARITRSSMVEALRQDYVRTARAKGLSEGAVVMGHALRNAGLPVVTVASLTFTTLLGGAIVTETIFAWPGTGRLLVQAVLTRDYPLVQASVFVTAVLVIFTNLVTDLVYLWLDPRIRLR